MEFQVAPEQLKTVRLVLRPFEPADVDDCHAYRDDPEFARYLPHIPQPFTRADAEAFVHRNMAEPWDRSPTFAIVFAGKVGGTVNLEVDPSARSAMIGYALGRDVWGHGLAPEAALAVMEWAFAAFPLERIWASTHPDNTRSQRVLQKLGMSLQPSGTEPTFAIAREEWRRRK